MADSSKTITILAIFVFILSMFSLGVFYLSAKSLFSTISGYATSSGNANLTVETVVAVNFTTNAVRWGSGRVNAGANYSYLNTESTNNVTNGNWTLLTPGGLILVNIGNVNVSLNMSGTKTAAQMIGGTNPAYTWRISLPESGGCTNLDGSEVALVAEYGSVNTTTLNFCPRFSHLDDQDSIRIDFNLTIPSDSFTGLLTDTITATVFASG